MSDEYPSNPDRRGLVPFQKGTDARRGNGPRPGAPNAGRPPDAVRAACRLAFDERVPMLAELADSGSPEIRLRAMDMLGKYGLGASFKVEGEANTPGVIVLPAMDIRDFVEGSRGTARSIVTDYDGEEYEYVIEEVETSTLAEEETVSPERVREILERRRRLSADGVDQ
jgi:hypothetical protein